jgi:iron only hydrogenase large subunit-like protein
MHPHLMPQVSTAGSPMEMFGALIRQQFKDEDVYSVAIMPCSAKKFEAQRPELEKDGQRLIDLVLTTDELARLIGGASITDNTRASAAEMKEMCDRYKASL